VTEPLKVWFAREILAHEAPLMRYLNRHWKRRDEIHDLRQEIYVRVYEAAARARPTISPKSFLFQTARNLMADRVRRSRVVSIETVGDLSVSNVTVDEISEERRFGARQDLKRLAAAIDALPPKCREIVWLRRVHDMPGKDVAARLGVNVRTVESHVLTGMRILADVFFGRETKEGRTEFAENHEENGSEHGKQRAD
jgi:RNA polymerase sigma factor (sigma-70 family)